MRCLTKIAIAAPMALGLSGCSDFGGPCTSIGPFAITVRATDASTGKPITGGLTLILDGAQHDSVTSTAGNEAYAGDQSGTYRVTVMKTGYVTQSKSNIVVDRDRCHLIPQTIEFQLSPAT